MRVIIQNLCVWKNKASNKPDAFLNVIKSPFFQLFSMAKPQQVSVGTWSDSCRWNKRISEMLPFRFVLQHTHSMITYILLHHPFLILLSPHWFLREEIKWKHSLVTWPIVCSQEEGLKWTVESNKKIKSHT